MRFSREQLRRALFQPQSVEAHRQRLSSQGYTLIEDLTLDDEPNPPGGGGQRSDGGSLSSLEQISAAVSRARQATTELSAAQEEHAIVGAFPDNP